METSTDHILREVGAIRLQLRSMSAIASHPGSPPTFSGGPNEDLTAFLDKAQLEFTTLGTDELDDPQRIVYLPSFLEGPALAWCLDPSRRNALQVVPAFNKLQAERRIKYAEDRLRLGLLLYLLNYR